MTPRQLLNRYGWQGSLRLIRDLLLTRLFFPGARLVRQPAYVRGARNMKFGSNFTAGVGIRLDVFASDSKPRLIIGDNVQMNDYVHIAVTDLVTIGDDVLIASRVFISDHNHGDYRGGTHCHPSTPPALRQLTSAPVHIGHRVWIGEQVCILPGIRIGNGAVVGASSVVTRDVPENTIVAGNPAKVIRSFNSATQQWDKA